MDSSRDDNNDEYQLQAITRDFGTGVYDSDDANFIFCLKRLMDCGATKVVTHYTLICSANVKNRGYIRGPEFANLDNILFNYDDKHKLLKTIIIKLSDTSSLQGMINIFWYLIDKREIIKSIDMSCTKY